MVIYANAVSDFKARKQEASWATMTRANSEDYIELRWHHVPFHDRLRRTDLIDWYGITFISAEGTQCHLV